MPGFAEFLQALFAQFAAAAAKFEAAKGRGIVISQRVVDPEGACLHLLEEAFGFQRIVGIEVGSKTKIAVGSSTPQFGTVQNLLLIIAELRELLSKAPKKQDC
jgi:hypothetical protein